jgi:DNA-binding NtrC family response regulator
VAPLEEHHADRVLVVDDEREVAKSLRRVLARRGFVVEIACGGREALERLESFEPDAVISDFRMPGMNGAELLAEVRRRTPRAVRLILTGYADVESVVAPVDVADIRGFLKKPWDADELVATLRRMLEERASVPPRRACGTEAP